MPKKSKMMEYEIAMSDDEDNIKVKMTEKKPARKRVERSEEAKQAMLKRLEEGRKKAFEVRMQNKANREKLKADEQEKTEKVSSYLKHEDIFEKKYSSKFEKLEEILSGIDSNFREIKEYKKQKREKQAKEAVEVKPEASAPMIKEQTSGFAPMSAPTPQLPVNKATHDEQMVSMAKGLPNYRLMKFGRKNY